MRRSRPSRRLTQDRPGRVALAMMQARLIDPQDIESGVDRPGLARRILARVDDLDEDATHTSSESRRRQTRRSASATVQTDARLDAGPRRHQHLHDPPGSVLAQIH
jgi:hypothetical protein